MLRNTPHFTQAFSLLRFIARSAAAVIALGIAFATMIPAPAVADEGFPAPYPGARCEIGANSREACWRLPEEATAETFTLVLLRGAALIAVEQPNGVRTSLVLKEGDERTVDLQPGSVVVVDSLRDPAVLHVKTSFPTLHEGATCRVASTQSTVCWGLAHQEGADQHLTIALSHGEALVTVETSSGAQTTFVMHAGDSRRTVTLKPGSVVKADGGPAGATLSVTGVAPR